MDQTNAEKLRANLKEWLDAARKEPVKVVRKSGEAFVIINADQYQELLMELASLRGLALGLSDTIQGRVKPVSSNFFQEALSEGKQRAKSKAKQKKAAG